MRREDWTPTEEDREVHTVEYRAGLEVLQWRECLRLLASYSIGSVAVTVDGSPTIFPVKHHVVDIDTIVFRSDRSMLPHTSGGSRMSLEVDGIDDTAQSWSVIVHGFGREVVAAELARLRELGLEPPAPGQKTHWIRILPDKITGRRIAQGA
jgi:nitroimidazol reductase NimA-like FMN-containing flavoprotein (pyridoxamine 5'-phosphate oxidase superfamily)